MTGAGNEHLLLWMRRAARIAWRGHGGAEPNPMVGCVLLDSSGRFVAEGYHRRCGGLHAEADALARAGTRVRNGTAVVTLEPCNHTGRTGPCAQALIGAGVARVVVAHSDPNPVAAGGVETLRAAGIDVEVGLLGDESQRLNRAWLHGLTSGRPLVTWKFATTLDGRSAAADGSSRWISNAAARRDVHQWRRDVDVVLVGTETALSDDPQLTARSDDGRPLPRDQQPLRVVMGERALPTTLRLFDDDAPSLVLPTRDPIEALRVLYDQGRRHVYLEGGPTLAAAFVRAGLVDEIVAYVAPVLLGAGRQAVADLGITTIADALRPRVVDTTVLWDTGEEPTVRLTLATGARDGASSG